MRFSIIMPVYNVENYLSSAIESVLSQSFSDFELILVNDASTDSSPLICEKYAKNDNRIKTIHKPINQGLSQARNTGLDKSVGEYIWFIDSDDFIAQDSLQIINQNLKENLDILVFGINRFFQNKNEKTYKQENLKPNSFLAKTKSQIGTLLIDLNKTKVFPFAWNKVYRRKFLQQSNVKFTDIKLIEDFLFNIDIFYRADEILVIDKILYNYRRPFHQTLVNTYCKDFFNLVKQKFFLEKEFLQKTDCATAENLQYIYFIFVKHLISYFIRNQSPQANLNVKQQKQLIAEALKDKLTQKILDKYNPTSKMKIVLKILKSNNPTACYVLSFVIRILRKN